MPSILHRHECPVRHVDRLCTRVRQGSLAREPPEAVRCRARRPLGRCMALQRRPHGGASDNLPAGDPVRGGDAGHSAPSDRRGAHCRISSIPNPNKPPKANWGRDGWQECPDYWSNDMLHSNSCSELQLETLRGKPKWPRERPSTRCYP